MKDGGAGLANSHHLSSIRHLTLTLPICTTPNSTLLSFTSIQNLTETQKEHNITQATNYTNTFHLNTIIPKLTKYNHKDLGL